jgi:hypothetical protein
MRSGEKSLDQQLRLFVPLPVHSMIRFCMSFITSPGAAGMIRLQILDRERWTHIDLAAWEWECDKALEAAWHSIPTAPAQTDFIADHCPRDGCGESRFVARDWIEAVTGRSIEAMTADGRLFVIENAPSIKAMFLNRRTRIPQQGRPWGGLA